MQNCNLRDDISETQSLLIGVDPGAARCGFAKADPSSTLASPLCVLPTKPLDTLAERLLVITSRQPVNVLVVGLPLDQHGQEGFPAQQARKIGEKLKAGLACEVEYLDERFTTAEMTRRRKDAGVSRRKGLKDIDAWAAASILQAYLDRRKA